MRVFSWDFPIVARMISEIFDDGAHGGEGLQGRVCPEIIILTGILPLSRSVADHPDDAEVHSLHYAGLANRGGFHIDRAHVREMASYEFYFVGCGNKFVGSADKSCSDCVRETSVFFQCQDFR